MNRPLNHQIFDSTEVVVIDPSGVTWSGPLVQLELDNEFDDAECAVVRSALGRKGLHLIGGGAADHFVIELAELGYQPSEYIPNRQKSHSA